MLFNLSEIRKIKINIISQAVVDGEREKKIKLSLIRISFINRIEKVAVVVVDDSQRFSMMSFLLIFFFKLQKHKIIINF
jgi:hypothetical protein